MDNTNKEQITNQPGAPPPNAPRVGESKFSFKSLNKKILIPVVIVIFLAAIVPYVLWQSFGPRGDKKVVGEIRTSLATGNYEKSKSLIKREIEKGKDNSVYLGSLIQTIALEGNQTGNEAQSFKEAMPYIEEALKQYGDNSETLIAVGYTYETAGKYEEALLHYEKALAIDPNSARAFFHKGHVLEFLNRESESLEAYNKAYSLDPDNPLILIKRGNIFLSQSKLNKAKESFGKASTSQQASYHLKSEALVALSRLLRSEGDLQNALETSKKAVELDSSFSPALGTHGYNLALVGKREEGIMFLKKAIDANPRISLNYNNLAQVLRAEKNFQEAINYQKTAASKINDDNTILSEDSRKSQKAMYIYDLAKSYDMSGLSVDVIPLLQQSLELHPALVELLRLDYSDRGYFKRYSDNPNFLSLLNK